MKRLVCSLAAALAGLLSVQAYADEGVCLEGDTRLGPNCVHEEARVLRESISTVYRLDGKSVRVVWNGVGTVKTSTPSFIIVVEPVSDESGRVRLAEVRHDWNGSSYGR